MVVANIDIHCYINASVIVSISLAETNKLFIPIAEVLLERKDEFMATRRQRYRFQDVKSDPFKLCS